MNFDSNTIIKQINKFDKKAYNTLFDLMYSGLCQFAESFVYDKNTAEDLVQELFIKLIEKKHQFPTFIALKVFLYRSTKNACINFLKKKKNIVSDELNNLESEDHFNEAVLEEEIIINLYQAIKKLPNNYAQIMQLSLSGLKNNEIASELNLSINTIKTHKKNAYKLLRELLSNSFLLSIIPYIFK